MDWQSTLLLLMCLRNPREAQAREVIEAWVEKGYTLRYVVTKVLLALHSGENNYPEIRLVIDELIDLVRGLEGKVIIEEKNSIEGSILSAAFTTAIKNSARLGIGTK